MKIYKAKDFHPRRRTVWMNDSSVFLIEQNLLPFKFQIYEAKNYLQTCQAIKDMKVRGAGAIGAAAGFAMAQAFLEAPKDNLWDYVEKAKKEVEATRPTARNMFCATNRVFNAAAKSAGCQRITACREAQRIADEDVKACKAIGEYGNSLIANGANIQTHCNAGRLAFVDYGTALAPIYLAHENGKSIFVYVDETRPRNQGAKLTAWELQQAGIPYAIISDNAGAYLMSQRKINLIIVGADRIAANGDVANKIGTLEKAIAAKEFNISFYVAAPTSTFDLTRNSGVDIPIEERGEDEVLFQTGLNKDGNLETILVSSPGSKALNPAFDITPAKYITAIITERGIIKPTNRQIKRLFS